MSFLVRTDNCVCFLTFNLGPMFVVLGLIETKQEKEKVRQHSKFIAF